MTEFIGRIAEFDWATFVLAAALTGAVTGASILLYEGLFLAGFILTATVALLSFVLFHDVDWSAPTSR